MWVSTNICVCVVGEGRREGQRRGGISHYVSMFTDTSIITVDLYKFISIVTTHSDVTWGATCLMGSENQLFYTYTIPTH